MGLESYFKDFSRRDWYETDVDGTVRIAIVGIGGFSQNRALPAIDTADYCETTVLVTGSPDSSAEIADEFDVDTLLSYEEFLDGQATDAYDAVYIATPNTTHGQYATAAAEFRKHVICEKPLETTVQRAQEVIDACEDAGVTLMTAYRLQLEPSIRRTRELIAGGVIGDVVQIHAGFSNPLLEHAGADTWRLDPDLAGGGALVDLGVYPLNTIRFLLESDPVVVTAYTYSVDDAFANVDEHVAFQLEFPGSVTASCTASYNAHAASGLRAVGTEGMVSVSSPFGGVVPQDIYVECGDVGMEYRGAPGDEVVEEFDYFGYCVLTGTDPEPGGEDSLRDIVAVDAIYDAAESGHSVEISDVK
jgi:D-xylose 1-dehydrogenase (NADP+, D-xylono-1,4-lactone-forming)